MIPDRVRDAYWSDVKPGTEAALERVVAAMSLPPASFSWTPAMQAIWPAEMRPTMSGLLAIWEAMREAAVYTSVPGPAETYKFTPWYGGQRPVSGETNVAVLFRCPSKVHFPTNGKAEKFRWQQWGMEDDIVAYRVVS